MKRLPRGVRARVLVRSFAVQGSWNYETLIGTGFAYTLLPALRHLYGEDGDRLERAVANHAELFNSHPYFATLAVGAVAKLEADGVDPLVIHRFKNAVRGSLGSLGDRLIWFAWRPMTILGALTLLLAGAPWWLAIAVFLLTYNLMHLTVRVRGLGMGSETGLEVGRLLREVPIQPLVERASQTACLFVGMAVILAGGRDAMDPAHWVTTAAAVGLGFLLGIHSRRAMVAVLFGITILASILGLAGYGT